MKPIDSSETQRLTELLFEVEQALDDWIITYAPDLSDENAVRESWARIMDGGGTLSYVTNLRERVSKARKV